MGKLLLYLYVQIKHSHPAAWMCDGERDMIMNPALCFSLVQIPRLGSMILVLRRLPWTTFLFVFTWSRTSMSSCPVRLWRLAVSVPTSTWWSTAAKTSSTWGYVSILSTFCASTRCCRVLGLIGESTIKTSVPTGRVCWAEGLCDWAPMLVSTAATHLRFVVSGWSRYQTRV